VIFFCGASSDVRRYDVDASVLELGCEPAAGTELMVIAAGEAVTLNVTNCAVTGLLSSDSRPRTCSRTDARSMFPDRVNQANAQVPPVIVYVTMRVPEATTPAAAVASSL
jgi:NaMN:DMB phosphoribosyltransferase